MSPSQSHSIERILDKQKAEEQEEKAGEKEGKGIKRKRESDETDDEAEDKEGAIEIIRAKSSPITTSAPPMAFPGLSAFQIATTVQSMDIEKRPGSVLFLRGRGGVGDSFPTSPTGHSPSAKKLCLPRMAPMSANSMIHAASLAAQTLPLAPLGFGLPGMFPIRTAGTATPTPYPFALAVHGSWAYSQIPTNSSK